MSIFERTATRTKEITAELVAAGIEIPEPILERIAFHTNRAAMLMQGRPSLAARLRAESDAKAVLQIIEDVRTVSVGHGLLEPDTDTDVDAKERLQ